MSNKLERLAKFRTRWLRWLGQKTRDAWVDLLDSNWSGWASKTLDKHNVEEPPLIRTCESVRLLFSKAIECADMRDLHALDELYCIEKYNL